MMHSGFLQAICEDPDDDAHRLIYADWLEDHGDVDRAEFIRLQCDLARHDEEDVELGPMRLRETALLREHREAWRAELPVLPKVGWGNGFRRGFVEGVSLPNYLVWRSQGLAMLAATPLEMVCIHRVTPNTVRRLARSPGIERVRGLDFTMGHCGSEDLEVLGKACRLSSFSYHSPSSAATVNLDQDAGRILATSPGFAGLRQLGLDNTQLGDGGAARLTSAANLAELETLRLTRCDLTAVGVRLLANLASWPRLRSLDLTSNYAIGDAGARAIASCPGMTGLRELRLSGCGIGSAGATALARSMFLTNLRHLDLNFCPVGSDGVRTLMTSSNLRSLRTLHLASTHLSGEDIVALLRSSLGENLQELNLRGNALDAESVVGLSATPGLEHLARLFVSAGEGNELLRQRFGERITIL